jgi:hypothetical protein
VRKGDNGVLVLSSTGEMKGESEKEMMVKKIN